MRDLARLAAENVAAVLAGREPASLVNPQINWRSDDVRDKPPVALSMRASTR